MYRERLITYAGCQGTVYLLKVILWLCFPNTSRMPLSFIRNDTNIPILYVSLNNFGGKKFRNFYQFYQIYQIFFSRILRCFRTWKYSGWSSSLDSLSCRIQIDSQVVHWLLLTLIDEMVWSNYLNFFPTIIQFQSESSHYSAQQNPCSILNIFVPYCTAHP